MEIILLLFKLIDSEICGIEFILVSQVLLKMTTILRVLCEVINLPQLIDLSFTFFYKVCLKFPYMLKSNYFKFISKNFFEIEPYKHLFSISRLIQKNKLNVSAYFLEHLQKIFENMKIWDMLESFPQNTQDVQLVIQIMQLFIVYFTEFNYTKLDYQFIYLKMCLIYLIQKKIINKLD